MEQLNAEETHILEQLRTEPIVEQAYTLGQQFLQIVRQRQHDAFDGWLAASRGAASLISKVLPLVSNKMKQRCERHFVSNGATGKSKAGTRGSKC
jgi:hypothetical protein